MICWFVNFEVTRSELTDPSFGKIQYCLRIYTWMEYSPPDIPERCILEFNKCNMCYSVVKTNANKTTAMVFISRWVLSKNAGRMTTKLGSKPKKKQ